MEKDEGSSVSMLIVVFSGIFLENIFKHQNDRSDNFGRAILAQKGAG